MFINNIKLKNFRNYEDLDLNFSSKKVLLVGKNAQGKTNLLEAIYYLSSLNSIKAKQDSELIKWNEDFAHLEANFDKCDLTIDLDVTINPPKKKILKVNGIKKAKSSEFISNISAVSFSTSDLLLLRGSPEDRRKWLDLAISQVYPAFLDRLSKYNKIRTQKNNYLKDLRCSCNINNDSTLLDVWNEQLAVAGSNIIYLRLNFLKEISKFAQEKHKNIANGEILTLAYETSLIENVSNSDLSNAEILALFKMQLEEKKQEEIARGQSVVGPHRDDISFFINGIDSKKFASQGQQRTIVLALKLAELEIIRNKIGESAILLLDDVLAELDNIRQNYLLNAIEKDTQTIITSVDTLHFDERFLEEVEIFNITSNNITATAISKF